MQVMRRIHHGVQAKRGFSCDPVDAPLRGGSGGAHAERDAEAADEDLGERCDEVGVVWEAGVAVMLMLMVMAIVIVIVGEGSGGVGGAREETVEFGHGDGGEVPGCGFPPGVELRGGLDAGVEVLLELEEVLVVCVCVGEGGSVGLV